MVAIPSSGRKLLIGRVAVEQDKERRGAEEGILLPVTKQFNVAL